MRISDWSSDVCSSDLFGVIASSVSETALRADIVFLSLPSINEVEQVCTELRLLAQPGPLKTIVDMSTSDLERTRKLAMKLQAQGVVLVDAPVARSRAAAQSGTLLITVGAEQDQFDGLKPYRSEEHTSELQSLMRISYAVFCLKTKK